MIDTANMEIRIAALEGRIASLEADRNRLLEAFKSAAEMAMKHPMAITMMPKDMRKSLETFIAGNK